MLCVGGGMVVAVVAVDGSITGVASHMVMLAMVVEMVIVTCGGRRHSGGWWWRQRCG